MDGRWKGDGEEVGGLADLLAIIRRGERLHEHLLDRHFLLVDASFRSER